MTAPTVSVITPLFDGASTIEETIASVQAQTFADWELLVADDASRDAGPEIVAASASADPRIRLLRAAHNGGPARARNLALEAARGRYVAFLDADDTWLPTKLERQLAFMRATGCALSYSGYRRVDQTGTRVGRLVEVPERITYDGLLKQNVIACLTAVVDTAQTGPLRMVDEGYDDYILWLELLRRGYVGRGLPEDLARYRIMPGSVSRRRGRAIRWVWNIQRNVERLPLLHAAWYFANYAIRTSLKHARF